MRRIIIYRGLAVAVLLMAASVAQAEVVGIKDANECPKKLSDPTKADEITSITNLKTILANISPETYPQYFKSDQKKFVLCMEDTSSAKVFEPVEFANTSQYPIVIYGLAIDNGKKNPDGTYKIPTGTSILTIGQGTGEIALQSMKAEGLRGPILLQGKSTLLSSTLSCDAANTTPAITVSSDKNTFRKVAINECAQGLEVSGSYNIFSEVAIKKTVTEGGDSSLGDTAVSSNGDFNHFLKMTLAGYKYGVKVNGNYIKIASSTLDGALGAVVIGHNAATNAAYSPVTASQNNYTTVNTITYVDANDAKAHTLFDVGHMGVAVDDKKPTVAIRAIGKLLDSTNASSMVEVTLREELANKDFKFIYFKGCKVFTVINEDKIGIMVKSDGGNIENSFLPGEKFFDCDLTVDANKMPIEIRTTDHLRFFSNTPTVSLMSDDIDLGSFGIIPTTAINPGQTISGGSLNDIGGGMQVATIDGGGLSGATPSPSAGGGQAPSPTGGEGGLIVDEAQKESGDSGSAAAMTPGGIQLEAAPSAAGGGLSTGGCSLLRDDEGGI